MFVCFPGSIPCRLCAGVLWYWFKRCVPRLHPSKLWYSFAACVVCIAAQCYTQCSMSMLSICSGVVYAPPTVLCVAQPTSMAAWVQPTIRRGVVSNGHQGSSTICAYVSVFLHLLSRVILSFSGSALQRSWWSSTVHSGMWSCTLRRGKRAWFG